MRDPSARFSSIVLLGFVAICAAVVWFRFGFRSSSTGGTDTTHPVDPAVVARFTALESRERELEETVWAPELLAQQCGRVFENLWDALNRATNDFAILASWPAGEIIPPRWNPPEVVAHGIDLRRSAGNTAPWNAEQWRRFLDESAASGWRLVQTEFRHVRFEPDSSGRPRQSRFQFSAHLLNAARVERAILEGELVVDWAAQRDTEGLPAIRRVDAGGLSVKFRRGEPPFRRIFEQSFTPPAGSYFIDPLILYDLDGDGLSEIVLAAKNTVLRRRAGGGFNTAPLCREDPGLIFTGLIADFDADGAADFLCAKFEGLFLFQGSSQGTLDRPGRLVWKADPRLKYAQVMTCGDVDGDGDLDVWLGQYKLPYERGQMPTPYHDANDGHPAWLLLNDRRGNFVDATETSGLAGKRWRRTYSASLVDLDGDRDLDLMVVSDFAGTDLYQNDGRGRFKDVTTHWLDEPHAAGMAHAVTDFDRDGLLDLLIIGMHSPTADRLRHLGLSRPGFPNDAEMRAQLMHGNRLYLGGRAGGFRQGEPGASIARSGWSWGCSAFDFDNDGYPDAYIANGHESRESVREYEPEIWLHDAYVASSKEDRVLMAYFNAKMSRTRGRGYSFGGYEKNRLYLNRRGASFFEAGHLMGVSLEEDCRGVVADDLDGDGRVDLLVTTFEAWPVVRQRLLVFQNNMTNAGNWIGVRLREQGNGISPVGARIIVRTNEGERARPILTGDSYRAQHANTAHFGLGGVQRLERVEIRSVDGRLLVLREPAINRYHDVLLPEGK